MRDRPVGKFKASLFAFKQVTGFVPSPPGPDRLRSTKPSIQSIRYYFLMVKSKHWPPSSAQAQNSWHSTYTPPRSLRIETLDICAMESEYNYCYLVSDGNFLNILGDPANIVTYANPSFMNMPLTNISSTNSGIN
jgi:hypothetical protein